jgi:Protein of unknown function with HXXEE motif
MNVPVGVTAGLFGAWLVHDLEEWFTMAPWSRKNADKIGQTLPVRPPWGDGGMSDVHAHAGIAAMGAVILAASAMGVKSRGRSTFFQTALLGFGLHGLSHLGGSALFRGYTPGVVTAPIVVLPYWVWARRTLDRAGVLQSGPSSWASAAVAVPVTIGGVHLATAGLLKARELARAARSTGLRS